MADDGWKYKDLKRAGGESAPQGYDEGLGDWDPIRTNKGQQLVEDADVKAELESIKSEITEQKQQNAEILERLDGVFDTKLIGSNVEYGEVVFDEDIVVTDTSYYQLDVDARKYRRIVIKANSTLKNENGDYVKFNRFRPTLDEGSSRWHTFFIDDEWTDQFENHIDINGTSPVIVNTNPSLDNIIQYFASQVHQWRISTVEEPTEGSIRITILGVI